MGPPRCRFCGLEFGDESGLRRHYHEEHKIEGGGETGRGGTDSVVPPHADDLERTAPDGESREGADGEDRERGEDDAHPHDAATVDDAHLLDATGDDADEADGSGI